MTEENPSLKTKETEAVVVATEDLDSNFSIVVKAAVEVVIISTFNIKPKKMTGLCNKQNRVDELCKNRLLVINVVRFVDVGVEGTHLFFPSSEDT